MYGSCKAVIKDTKTSSAKTNNRNDQEPNYRKNCSDNVYPYKLFSDSSKVTGTESTSSSFCKLNNRLHMLFPLQDEDYPVKIILTFI
jgi:hypothetical protein